MEVDTMRKLIATVLTLALVMVLVVPMAALADNEGKRKDKGRGVSIRGKIQVEGIVTSMDFGSSMFTMRVTKHANRVGNDNLIVLVQRGTALRTAGRGNDDDDDDDDDKERARRIATISDIRVGDRVKLEGFRLDDGRILAVKLQIRNRRIVGRPDFQGVEAQGVVTSKGFNTLTVVSGNGITRTVLVTPATDVRGQRNSFAAIQTNDVVVVQGNVNADGTVSASRIEVVFASGGTAFNGGSTQRTGVITAKSSTSGQFLILDNSFAVNVSGDTRILWGGQLRSFADLQVGQRVMVSGDPIRVGGITVGINARVISL
jgi:hypothetical protein